MTPPTEDPTRRARLLEALRSSVRTSASAGGLRTGDLGRLDRRRRDCASLHRLGRPATEARDLAARLDAALGLGVGQDAAARTEFALELTGLLVRIYDDLLAELRRG